MLGSAIAHTPKYMSFDGSINVSMKQRCCQRQCEQEQRPLWGQLVGVRGNRGCSVRWMACSQRRPAPMREEGLTPITMLCIVG